MCMMPKNVINGRSKTNSFPLLMDVFCFLSHFVLHQEENAVDPPQSVQRGVTELVEAALTPRNLCMMDPTWHPWF